MSPALSLMRLGPYSRLMLLFVPAFANETAVRVDYHPSLLVLMMLRVKGGFGWTPPCLWPSCHQPVLRAN